MSLPWPLPESGRIKHGDFWFDASNLDVRLLAYRASLWDWRHGLRPDKPVRDATVQEWYVNRSLAMSQIVSRLEAIVEEDRSLAYKIARWLRMRFPGLCSADPDTEP